MTAPTSSGSPVPCPACGTPSTGRFCSECGATVRGTTCPACRAILAPGARFCHRCGTAIAATSATHSPMPAAPTGGAPAATRNPGVVAPAAAPRNVLPWTFLGLAIVALLVIVVAQRSGTMSGASPADAPLAGGVTAAPDISSMSPRERATRLFDHIMRLASEGKQDSVTFFAPMALSAYEVLGDMDADLRYDYGRIAEVSGNLELAQAEADTLLKSSPDHLLGLILAARVAGLKGDRNTQQALEKHLLAVEATERKKNLPEYQLHAGDIEAAVAQANDARKP